MKNMIYSLPPSPIFLLPTTLLVLPGFGRLCNLLELLQHLHRVELHGGIRQRRDVLHEFLQKQHFRRSFQTAKKTLFVYGGPPGGEIVGVETTFPLINGGMD